MSWKKPEDLVLVAECATLPELEILTGLLATADIESTSMTTSESAAMFGYKSLFSPPSDKPLPYKLLVRKEDGEEAVAIISAPLQEELPDDED
jgi:hypothetical protein